METVSGKLVDFRKTRFHDAARQSEAASTNKKNGGTSGGTMWSWQIGLLQQRTYHRNCLKLLHKRVLYKQRWKSVKTTAWPSFFVWTAGKRTSSIAHKTRGSYKDDRTSNRVDVFSIERGRKRTYKGVQYFCQGHDRESCGTHLFLLDWYFVPHFTLDN